MKRIASIVLLASLTLCWIPAAGQKQIKRPAAKKAPVKTHIKKKTKQRKGDDIMILKPVEEVNNMPVVTEQALKDIESVSAVREQVTVVPVKPAPSRTQENIFVAVEQQASFPGGQGALMQYIASHLIYPETAAENDIQGRVIVKFVVEKDGSISSAQVVKGVDRALDQEALRVVKGMPKWNPGMTGGEPVRSWYTIPVTFRLQQ